MNAVGFVSGYVPRFIYQAFQIRLKDRRIYA